MITAIKRHAIFCAILCLTSFFTACREKQINSATDADSGQPDFVSRVPIDDGPDAKTAWYPSETTFKENGRGFDATPPKGWSYIGTTIGGGAFYLKDKTKTSVTCTCNMGIGGCRPFEAKGPWGTTRGCIGNCTNCTMSTSASYGNYNVAQGGYFNPNSSSRLLKNGESAPALFAELAELPEFQRGLKAFVDKAYEGKEPQKPVFVNANTVTAPDGYVLVGATVMGRGLALIVPEGFAKRELGYVSKTTASCACSNKTGECKLHGKTFMGMGSIWCDGTCNGCKLTTTSSAALPANRYEVSIFSANF